MNLFSTTIDPAVIRELAAHTSTPTEVRIEVPCYGDPRFEVMLTLLPCHAEQAHRLELLLKVLGCFRGWEAGPSVIARFPSPEHRARAASALAELLRPQPPAGDFAHCHHEARRQSLERMKLTYGVVTGRKFPAIYAYGPRGQHFAWESLQALGGAFLDTKAIRSRLEVPGEALVCWCSFHSEGERDAFASLLPGSPHHAIDGSDLEAYSAPYRWAPQWQDLHPNL
jgi:hypothetical protein